MHGGVGPKDTPVAAGVDVELDLCSAGQHLQDHIVSASSPVASRIASEF